MDSFFSLFDPSDGAQKQKKKHSEPPENVKKKGDAPKGRRRGRRANGKNETLPEESSFLCEPDLSTEVLVKDGSYIESYMELNVKDDDSKQDSSKPKRRNSGRKNRRKKNKISPAKDVPTTAWSETEDQRPAETWNNQLEKPKICVDSVGKNVNDLKSGEFKSVRRKNGEDFDVELQSDVDAPFEETTYNVIEHLEKATLDAAMFLAEDCAVPTSSDTELGDTTSDESDSGGEVYGSLPPEPRFGNVEYKLQLVAPCERRFQHLVTQLKWRLRSGGGSAVYVLGVRDCGALRGLRAKALAASIATVRRMAGALGATVAHVAARAVQPGHRAVAELHVRKMAGAASRIDVRVAVLGADQAGKSTLVGVLTQGELDNGRGSARLNMFRHLHEVRSGRTSSLSHEILGFDAQGNVVNYGCSELMTAERIGERSTKLVSFLDLAGHSKYQRTTLHGLTGYCPHYAMLVISATAGITDITLEHLGLLAALRLPFLVVVSKCELAPAGGITELLASLRCALQHHGKKPVLITDENMARDCVGPHSLIIDALGRSEDELIERDESEGSDWRWRVVPVFPVSCVRGAGLAALHAALLALHPPDTQRPHEDKQESCEFQIDEIFHVGESAGPVVGGLLARGQLREGDTLIMGPLETGAFTPVSVRSIYRNRVPHGSARAGQCASVGLAAARALPRPGMVLLTPPPKYGQRTVPTFGGCPPGQCKTRGEVAELIQSCQQSLENAKHRKNVRRKNKNLLQDLAKVEDSLVKEDCIEDANIYRSDSEPEKEIIKSNSAPEIKENNIECVCSDKVVLEDPNDPRGCIYFQASVHVLRHSTAIAPGFQCSVHVGNVRQTAIIQGIMSYNNELRAGESASAVFRFARCPEYLVRGRRLLLTAGLGTRQTMERIDTETASMSFLPRHIIQHVLQYLVFGMMYAYALITMSQYTYVVYRLEYQVHEDVSSEPAVVQDGGRDQLVT